MSHLGRRLLGVGSEDAVSYILSLMEPGNAGNAHWPLADTSWSQSADEIEEVLGGSDGTEDHWLDVQASPSVTPSSASGIGTLPGNSTAFTITDLNGVNTGSTADRLILGKITTGGAVVTNNTGTILGFSYVGNFSNGNGIQATTLWESGGEQMDVYANSTNPDKLRIGSTQVEIGNAVDFDDRVTILASVQTDASTATARFFADGGLVASATVPATLEVTGTREIVIYAHMRPGSGTCTHRYQHWFYLPNVALTDAQIIKALTLAGG